MCLMVFEVGLSRRWYRTDKIFFLVKIVRRNEKCLEYYCHIDHRHSTFPETFDDLEDRHVLITLSWIFAMLE